MIRVAFRNDKECAFKAGNSGKFRKMMQMFMVGVLRRLVGSEGKNHGILDSSCKRWLSE